MIRSTRRASGPKAGSNRPEKMEKIVALARTDAQTRQAGYRAQSLKIHPWVCARCGRIFDKDNLTELTVHHKDHNHDNNPADGSNWENLCIYCHDNEHARYTDHLAAGGMDTTGEREEAATYSPFAQLREMLEKKRE
ncbi:YajD family HNH nuclease [Candidatus Magnetaquicoccus inordinatus]|uniref:YajD family HNH nuclease n=1 Tax=Candidatus Magnetaquicoccus inordinatus TaxID=2496818 RepID=UPI00102BFDCF|nr:YajD family HNH nuclease [Candidatus Magnetaquicoccus inordinatus]